MVLGQKHYVPPGLVYHGESDGYRYYIGCSGEVSDSVSAHLCRLFLNHVENFLCLYRNMNQYFMLFDNKYAYFDYIFH